MGGYADRDLNYHDMMTIKIMDKDEMDVILEALIKTGHEALADSVKKYMELYLCEPYETFPSEFPVVCFAPI